MTGRRHRSSGYVQPLSGSSYVAAHRGCPGHVKQTGQVPPWQLEWEVQLLPQFSLAAHARSAMAMFAAQTAAAMNAITVLFRITTHLL